MSGWLVSDPYPSACFAERLVANNKQKLSSTLNQPVDRCRDKIDTRFYHFIRKKIDSVRVASDVDPLLFRLVDELAIVIRREIFPAFMVC
ncbi:MAG: hypothetical protein V6Z86_01695 [Hyphomicrobiales bacterium]